MKRQSGTSASLVLAVLSAIHVYWAAGGKRLRDGAIPEQDGTPAFQPGPILTLAVAAGLAAAAVVVQQAGSARRCRGTAGAVGVLFALRAIGDFRSVGFFKQKRRSRFAKLDTLVYSPLCVLISALSLGAAR